MASEILVVPEYHLLDVIGVIRRGLDGTEPEEVAEWLARWCDSEEEYYTEGFDYEDD